MQGLGFLIWQLHKLTPIEAAIEELQNVGAKWVSIKALDGTYDMNYVDPNGNKIGNPSYLLFVIEKLRAAGIDVGIWGWVNTYNIVAQALAAVRKVAQLGASHFLIDAEEYKPVGAYWKDPGADSIARAYMDNLALPFGFPVALCSYRFPQLHLEFPFATFLKHPRINFVASQMYWTEANNPGQQLTKSIAQYDLIRKLPHVPIGSASLERGWEPTPGQIREFVLKAQELGCQGWGFWDLDEAVYRKEWLSAMSETYVPPIKEKYPTVSAQLWRVLEGPLNVRSTIIPSYKYGPVSGVRYLPSKVWFQLNVGQVIEAIETIVDGRNAWVRVGQQQHVAVRYDDKTFLTDEK